MRVGNVLVQSDQFGNYERNRLAAGNYCVELVMDETQGYAIQEPMIVTVVGDTTVTRHLSFYSDPPAGFNPIQIDCFDIVSPAETQVPPATTVRPVPSPTPEPTKPASPPFSP